MCAATMYTMAATGTTRDCVKMSHIWLSLLTIVLCCSCCYVQCQQSAQQQPQQQQKPQNKYQQIQYQMQQQQQYEYQQHLLQQQQQQHYYQQQYTQQQQQQQQQHQLQQPVSLALQQQQQQRATATHEQRLTPTQQSQMLKTGASLVVGDGTLEQSGGQKEFYSVGSVSDAQPVARRRPGTRKRKRRPQVGANEEQTPYWRGHVEDDTAALTATNAHTATQATQASVSTRRRKQPAIREPLAALEKEQKLYELRDRQRQEYATEHLATADARNKSYRRPYAEAKKEQQYSPTIPEAPGASASTGGTRSAAELKNILKNAGGLSLSEILQQKNLSLDDLLKGKQNAILALQSTAPVPLNKPDNRNKSGKPLGRLPALYPHLSSTNVDDTVDKVESRQRPMEEEPEDQQIKNKLKFPTLHKLKLFGTSSRANTTQSLGESTPTATTNKKRAFASSTTSTTTTTTTRTPIYKKRQQIRPTLKPPALFKVAPPTASAAITTITTTKDIPTTIQSILTTTLADQMENDAPEEQTYDEENDRNKTFVTAAADEFIAVPEEEVEAVEVLDLLPTNLVDATPASKAGEQTHFESSTSILDVEPEIVSSTTTEASKIEFAGGTTEISTTEIATTSGQPTAHSSSTTIKISPTSTTTASPSPRTLTTRLKSHYADRVEVQEQNSKEKVRWNSNKGSVQPDHGTGSALDELENFFEEPRDKSRPERNKLKVQNITPRIDRGPQHTTEHFDDLPDLDGVDDRTDLLELIEDRRSGNRLFKVLEQRNMTLEELIEHRKRGSSQLHLATIVQNRSRFFPGQKVVLRDNMDIVTAFENFPHFNLLNLKSVKPDDIKTDSQGSSYFTSIIDIEPTDEIYKDGSGDSNNIRGLNQPPFHNDKALTFFPSWKSLALASLATTTRGDTTTKRRNPFYLAQPRLLLEKASQELGNNNNDSDEAIADDDTDIDDDGDLFLGDGNNTLSNTAPRSIVQNGDVVVAIENEVALAHDLIDLELSGHGFKRSPAAAAAASKAQSTQNNFYAHMPAGIRSAIVASAAIVLTSLTTFMVIFVICRWKQRRRRKTSYMKTYNAMKSKLPNITNTSRRSSLHHNMEELMSAGVNTISAPTPLHQMQRQSSLLFPRGGNAEACASSLNAATAAALGSSCTNSLLSGRGGISCTLTNSLSGMGGSVTGSTTSLALSLRSAQNISTTKLNTMDPNSPEVQEYLFDTLRKSF